MPELDSIMTPEVLGHLYSTDRGSGVAKLFYPYAQSRDNVTRVHDEIYSGRFLATAAGHSLDLLGAGIGLGRNVSEPDDAYRRRLRLEYMILTSEGTLEDVRAIIAEALELDPGSIWIYFNESPSDGLTDLPYFVEIQLAHGVMLLGEEHGWFKFAGSDEARVASSEYGFNVGKWRSSREMDPDAFIAEINALLERILATGVQYVIGFRGGFRFSISETERTADSDRGFNTGRWRGTVS